MMDWRAVAAREMAETVKGSKVATKNANLSGCGKLGNLGYLAI
jgi:hypothetical protein